MALDRVLHGGQAPRTLAATALDRLPSGAKVSVYDPEFQLTSLAAFFAVNAFSSEELHEMFEAFSQCVTHFSGGGAEARWAVKLYEPGDEDRKLSAHGAQLTARFVPLGKPIPADASHEYREARAIAEKADEIVKAFNEGCSPSHFEGLVREINELTERAT